MFRKDLKQKPENVEPKLMQIDEKKEIKDPALLKKSVIVLIGVVIAFMFHGALDIGSFNYCIWQELQFFW